MITLTIPGRLSQDVADFAAASVAYSTACELSGEGGSTFPTGTIQRGSETVAWVSYNGKVWATDPALWRPGTPAPIFNPYA